MGRESIRRRHHCSADDVYFKTDNANGYGNAKINAWLVTTDFYQVRWSKTLIDYLKSVNDPRLSIVAEVPLQASLPITTRLLQETILLRRKWVSQTDTI